MATLAVACVAIPSGPIKLAMTSILITALIISVTKLEFFYRQTEDSKGKPIWKLKDFGAADYETIFPAWMAMLGAAYVVYMIAVSTQIISC